MWVQVSYRYHIGLKTGPKYCISIISGWKLVPSIISGWKLVPSIISLSYQTEYWPVQNLGPRWILGKSWKFYFVHCQTIVSFPGKFDLYLLNSVEKYCIRFSLLSLYLPQRRVNCVELFRLGLLLFVYLVSLNSRGENIPTEWILGKQANICPQKTKQFR